MATQRRSTIASFLCVAALAAGLSGCGRYRPPLPPEYLAPAAVENLVVTPSESAVAFSWTAADSDAQGKELKSAEGFSVERKELVNRGDETNPDVKFERIGYLSDKHVEVREKLRTEARAAGKVGRTVKSPEEFTKFNFVDSKVAKGKTYLYQIVPLNQGGTEGVVGQLTKVVFQGAQSAVVAMLPEDMTNAVDSAATAAVGGKSM
jgi:hypothetical protein